MNTPIVDFAKKYANSNALRLHMPGHKGNGHLGFEKYDITEIDGADVLYSANGIIAESQHNATKLFGTKNTFYSTEGSSLCIRAMLFLVKGYAIKNGAKPLIAAGRNAHKTFVSACALLNIDVEWLLPSDTKTVISCNITSKFLEDYFNSAKQKPAAIYITSPDYLGNTNDISSISSVCKKHGVLLVVDNAHGAYLKFMPDDTHPITRGADICCDSAHKTLPVLTGGAYLHIGRSAPSFFADNAQKALSLFASTSPSYLILQSLDAANRYIADNYCERLSDFVADVKKLKDDLADIGYTICGDESLKITISTKPYGYNGCEFAQLLLEKNIICEFCDPDYIVLMLTPETGREGLEKIRHVLCDVPRKDAILQLPPQPALKKINLSLAETLYAPCESLLVDDCLGKTFCYGDVACPPAVPVVLPGEEIDEKAMESFKYYGITKCYVIK